MRALVIDEAAKVEITRVVKHASDFKINSQKLKNPEFQPIGDDPDFCCHLNDGYRVVFSIEQLDGLWYRHLSVSVNSRTMLPSQAAVEMIMKEFGFRDVNGKSDVLSCDNVWIEDKIVPMAVNLLQQIEQK